MFWFNARSCWLFVFILACAKHYAGYPATQGGRDSSEADLSERKMRSQFLPPFREAVKAGCATLMTAYQAIDGVPCSANRWLLWDVLRNEWEFGGFLVTDWDNIGRMHREQKTCASLGEATRRALEAGTDMAMSTPAYTETAVRLVQAGQLDEALVDEAVERILRCKFELGLFDENRYADLEAGKAVLGCSEHRKLALESAYQSIVLLKNQDDLLPLSDRLERIAIIGPNAEDVKAQLGDWVRWSGQLGLIDIEDQHRESIVTVLDGIRKRAGAECSVEYARGCDVVDTGTELVAEAAALAREADVAIVVVGDNLSLTGETHDRANLDLSGGQQQLLEAVYATGTPMVVVLVSGKPLTTSWVAKHAHAILAAWNPGSDGGTAVARLLFGDRCPSGKLTVSVPYHVGQQPVHYDQLPGWHADKYVDLPKEPLFAFGYGLSYTSFAYSNLKLDARELAVGETLRVEIDVENTGTREGTEIVQLYVNDVYSSVTTPIKELKAFLRVDLAPGEKRTLCLEVPYERLALVNQDLETIVEPGEFEVMVGSSSRYQDLLMDRFRVR